MRLFHELLGPLELPDRFLRIVSLAPNLTDALFALGLGESSWAGAPSATARPRSSPSPWWPPTPRPAWSF